MTPRIWTRVAIALFIALIMLGAFTSFYFSTIGRTSIGVEPVVEKVVDEHGRRIMVIEVPWHKRAIIMLCFVGVLGLLIGIGFALGKARGISLQMDTPMAAKKSARRDAYYPAFGILFCYGLIFYMESGLSVALLSVDAALGVIFPTIMYHRILSRRLPADQLYLKLWPIPLWLGLATSIICTIVAFRHLSVMGWEELGNVLAISFGALLYGIFIGPMLFLPIGLYRAYRD